jgi:intracellular septation protein A
VAVNNLKRVVNRLYLLGVPLWAIVVGLVATVCGIVMFWLPSREVAPVVLLAGVGCLAVGVLTLWWNVRRFKDQLRQ